MWASITIVHGHLAHTVDAAMLVRVIVLLIEASIIVAPGANTVHWLSTSIVGALLESVGIWTGITIVGSSHCNVVQPASLVLVGFVIVGAGAVFIPCTNTVDWLNATILGALQVVVSIRTSITIVSRSHSNAISTASLVLVHFIVMFA